MDNTRIVVCVYTVQLGVKYIYKHRPDVKQGNFPSDCHVGDYTFDPTKITVRLITFDVTLVTIIVTLWPIGGTVAKSNCW
jgi:hypothetical protein